MSASSKKKLRKEQEAAKLTEKQQTAQNEAKKTKLYTTIFVVVIAIFLVVAIIAGINQTITNKGIREKNTVAMTVGDHEISNAELNYFYMDGINNFYSNYGSYASLFGLDVTQPLNKQIVDEETGKTWADDFLESAKSNAKAVHAMADAADAAGFELTNEEITTIEYNIYNIDTYASLYGYENGDAYLKAVYGRGATVDSYLEYSKLTALADAYYNHYVESLTYEDADLRAVDAENYETYSSYSFHTYYLSTSKFLTGGTTDDEGNTTYSDEEKAASVTAAEAAAESLTGEEIVTVEDFDAAIAALSVNEGTTAVSTANEAVLNTSISSTYAEWVTDSSRQAGDKTVIESATTDADGNKTVSGYYVIYYVGSMDNTFPLANVRHILVSFEHDETESEEHDHSGSSYTDAEKAAAKTAANELLAQWNAGDANEESFAALANENSDDGDGTTGGLYENVYPGQMVTNFNNWCFDDARKAGDTGVVETEYGYHVMYYVGDSDVTYRDYLIENELRSTDASEWYNATVDAMTVTEGNIKYLNMDLVLSSAA